MTKSINTKISDELHQELKIASIKKQLQLKELVSQILIEWLQKNKEVTK